MGDDADGRAPGAEGGAPPGAPPGMPLETEPRDAYVAQGAATVAALVGELTATLAEGEIDRAGDEARDIVAALVDQPRFWPALNRAVVLDERLCRQARRAAERRTTGA